MAAEIVERRLEEFNVSLERHVVCVTDDAAVMVQFGKSIPCEHQLCYAHGIHLAACDALYGKNATMISATASEEIRDEYDSPYLSQDEGLENEDFSTAVDLENDCSEVDISNESHINCDTINVSMIISQISFKESNFTAICSRGTLKKIIVDIGFQKQGGIAFMQC